MSYLLNLTVKMVLLYINLINLPFLKSQTPDHSYSIPLIIDCIKYRRVVAFRPQRSKMH